jgi:thioredoxin 1
MSKVKIIDFWAPWCGPCKIMNPILDELEKELPDVEFIKVNADEDPKQTSEHGVMGLPTFVILKDGKEVGRKVGVTKKEDLKALLTA